MKLIPVFLFICLDLLTGQQTIDGSFDFQTEEDKSYHIYVPSTYDNNVSNSLMLALHPLNTNRWDGQAWRDTLINFAEANSLILLSPDGGPDGKIDDPIDTAFTSLVLDSMSTWYNIDIDQRYIMGFSWGGKTTYTYGLNNASKFRGLMPIGAAIDINEVSDIIASAKDKAFYIVHGENDNPNDRYTPLYNGLQNNNACVEGPLMDNVGHTIDFPNRNEILGQAYQYLKTQNCNQVSQSKSIEIGKLSISPNPNLGSFKFNNFEDKYDLMEIYSSNGKRVKTVEDGGYIQVPNAKPGIYFMRVVQEDKIQFIKFIIN